LKAMIDAVEEMLVTGTNPNPAVRLNLKDLSQAPASSMLEPIIETMMNHASWDHCDACPVKSNGAVCPIWENRRRLLGTDDRGTFRRRLTALIEISEQNGAHFPVRQLLALVTNMLLGHPDAPDRLLSCKDVPKIVEDGSIDGASVYRNVFGENLSTRRAEK